jgi:hypothetical protein
VQDEGKPKSTPDAPSQQIPEAKATHKGESSLYAGNGAHIRQARIAMIEFHAGIHAPAQKGE